MDWSINWLIDWQTGRKTDGSTDLLNAFNSDEYNITSQLESEYSAVSL